LIVHHFLAARARRTLRVDLHDAHQSLPYVCPVRNSLGNLGLGMDTTVNITIV
jgi:hypothetical protein